MLQIWPFAKTFPLYLQSLPAPVKRRLKALKKVQLDATKIEAKFYEEVHKLECKYHEMYKPLYEKRTKITKGITFWILLCLGLHVTSSLITRQVV